MRGHLCRKAWRGRSASGGRDAGRQSLCVHSLLHPEIRPWHLSMGQGPLQRVPVSVRHPLPPVSPAARVRFNSLNVPHSVSQDTCPPIQTYLTLASKKPVRSPGWVLCPSEVPRKPHGPADGTLYGTKCPSLICTVSRAFSPGLDTLWLACV